ncbi:ATP-dependent nuclease [Herpetosiphon geysericola]|uniref:AAA+ ATPase domain-containing protein n=1 Tax=Herpetosiphon geysericola TaxID=70996 RepID=A0A0P6YES6_9CHLR|nr:ATP-binding protein [Herpetosiphon geysericola]KPL80624.1 hypothetical protein SE18_23715 [Herpetosiphon geysericola]
MYLKSITIQKFGPFFEPATLILEPSITVLTGRNDTGKSALLRAIQLLYSRKAIVEDDANIDWLSENTVSWKDDPDIRCNAIFTTKNMQQYVTGSNITNETGDIELQFTMSPNMRKARVNKVIYDDRKEEGSMVLKGLPGLMAFPIEENINGLLIEEKMNQLEIELMTLAFGENAIKRIQDLNKTNFLKILKEANKKINDLLKSMLQNSNLDIVLEISRISSNPLELSISILDEYQGETPLNVRGYGVRKIISLLVALLTRKDTKKPLLILFDEPENGLHADAQHFLRIVLEGLAKNENIQVIYTTHSPSMINPMLPTHIRLLERKTVDGKATTIINNQPIEENFALVRSSLGMNPADSLLYAPITIVVEGITEVFTLPLILMKFHAHQVAGFEKVKVFLSIIHLLDGRGGEMDYWCRMAQSQGCQPIIFADGDQRKRLARPGVREKLGDIPKVLLDEGSEIEDTVSKNIYFSALRVIIKEDGITNEAFEHWLSTSSLAPQMMFSKKVDAWLAKEFPLISHDYNKPQTMAKAIEIASIEDINQAPFLELVQTIDRLLNQR